MLTRMKLFTIMTILLSFSVLAAEKRPLQIDDLYRALRISDPAVSPDGKWIVYTVTTSDLYANKTTTDLWLVSADGGSPKQLTNDPADDRHAAWSPDGKWIAFESKRTGTSQIWLLNPADGTVKQFSNISTEATSPVWSPDGKSIAYVSSVWPEFSEKSFAESNELNRKKDKDIADNPVKTRVYTHLFVRHWDQWLDGKRQHIFVQPVAGGDAKDLTPGDRDAVPTSDTFSAGIDFAFSPDSKEIAYTATPAQNEAWSTNHDIYTVAVTGGTPKQITTNPAADGYPRYSPDGKYIAYRAQSVPANEADRWQLWLYDRATGKAHSITANFDASVGSETWAPDSSALYFDVGEQANVSVYRCSLNGEVKSVYSHGASSSITATHDGKSVIFTNNTLQRPDEIFRVNLADGKVSQVTHMNDELFAQIDIPTPESVTYAGDGGTKVQAWLLKPPQFDSSKKYPLVFMVHGGPQSAWTDDWHYRWNLSLWAAQGYVIFAPNPRGSTGFGQKFTDEISGDWGGKVFRDLVKGIEYAEALSYVDSTRKAAAGASFGGYMVNFFQGNLPGRFKTLICHDGDFDMRSAYGSTEELWFDEHERGGTPWEVPENYEKFSPSHFAKNFNTPVLILHGELDYRIPYTEALQNFTALQRKGIPSKLVTFPEENHWVLKPGDSKFWHETVFSWLAQYLK